MHCLFIYIIFPPPLHEYAYRGQCCFCCFLDSLCLPVERNTYCLLQYRISPWNSSSIQAPRNLQTSFANELILVYINFVKFAWSTNAMILLCSVLGFETIGQIKCVTGYRGFARFQFKLGFMGYHILKQPQGSLLLIWNTSNDVPSQVVGWNYLSIHKLQRLNRWILVMDK